MILLRVCIFVGIKDMLTLTPFSTNFLFSKFQEVGRLGIVSTASEGMHFQCV